MKAKHLILTLAATGVASMFSACSLDPYELPSKEQYTRAFIKEFGLIDPNQDWNLAERQSVTVNVAPSSEVKVHALINGAYYLVAKYDNVSGNKQIFFDVPEGTKFLKVTSGGQRYDATVGSTVDFLSPARRINSSTTVSAGTITVTDLTDIAYKDNWLRMPRAGALQYREIVPENYDNRDNTDITKNFLYESNGPIVIHPIYWHTNATNTLGIYYYCDSSTDGATKLYNYDLCEYVYVKKIPVYTIKADNNILFYADYTKVDATDRETVQSLSGVYTDFIKKESTAWTPINGAVESVGRDLLEPKVNEGVQLMSKGIKIDIPVGFTYGMYIDSSNGAKFYSESSLNSDPYVERTYDGDKAYNTATSATQKPWQACHAASFEGQLGGVALLFEDWTDSNLVHGGSDMDLNDMVFVMFGADPKNISGTTPTIKPVETVYDIPYGWIIAAEDLGSTDDFDFNDVVVGIEYVSGQTTAQLTALAAGGTLPIKLKYGDEVVLSSDGEEQFHSWFKNNPPTTTMINTSAIDYECKGKVSLTVPDDWSVSSYGDRKMGGFSLYVDRKDGTFDEIIPPGDGDAPQMICIPGGWAWPLERIDIRQAFPTFANWVNDHESNSDWYKTYVRSKLVKEPNYEGSGSGSSSGSSGSTGSTSVQDFSVPAPTVEDNGERIEAAGPEGYLQIIVDLSELPDASTMLRALKYYTTEQTEANKTSLINAIMAYYWSDVFYTPEDENDGNNGNNVQPEYSVNDAGYYSASGTRFGSGKTFKLCDIMSVVEASYSVSTSITAKVKLFVHVKQIESNGSGGGGGSDPINLTVDDDSGPNWNYGQTAYSITLPDDATLTEGSRLSLDITFGSNTGVDIYFKKGYENVDKIQTWSTSYTITSADVTALGDSKTFYILLWGGSTLNGARLIP